MYVFYMTIIDSWWQHDQAIPDIHLLSNIFQLVLEDPEEFPSQMRHLFTLACSRPILRSPRSWLHPENLQREAAQMHKPAYFFPCKRKAVLL